MMVYWKTSKLARLRDEKFKGDPKWEEFFNNKIKFNLDHFFPIIQDSVRQHNIGREGVDKLFDLAEEYMSNSGKLPEEAGKSVFALGQGHFSLADVLLVCAILRCRTVGDYQDTAALTRPYLSHYIKNTDTRPSIANAGVRNPKIRTIVPVAIFTLFNFLLSQIIFWPVQLLWFKDDYSTDISSESSNNLWLRIFAFFGCTLLITSLIVRSKVMKARRYLRNFTNSSGLG